MSDTLGQLASGDVSGKDRRRLLRRLAAALGRSARSAGIAGVGGGRWLTDLVVQTVPRVPIRDVATLSSHFGGRSGDALADALVKSASRTTAGIGAAAGALATAEWVAPPTLLSAPVQLVAETLAVAVVEVKLVAELHVAYGIVVPGSTAQRTTAFLTAWARRRGVDVTRPGAGLTSVIGGASRRELRDQLMRRMGRNLTTLGPVFTGALIGAELNRRATRGLGEAIRRDLLGRSAVGRGDRAT